MKAILTWHSIDESESVISTSRAVLARQLDALDSHGVKVVPLASIAALDDELDAAALTFDDGFANFASEAMPLLEERGHPATVFVVAGRAGMTNDWDVAGSGIPLLPLMTWDEIRSLGQHAVDIGGHSITHQRLSGLKPDELDHEVAGCAAMILEHTGVSPRTFAFPFGDHDSGSVAAVSRAFEIACTTEFSVLSRSSSVDRLPRLDMFYFRDPRMLNSWGERSFRAFVAMRGAARAVRERMRT